MRIGLVAGEASGDHLGAELIKAIRDRIPGARFEGVAGPEMQAAGCDAWEEAEALAVFGLVEPLVHLPRLLKLRRSLIARWRAARPDVFVGIDAPDFNFGLEKALRKSGIPTAHYVSPTIWAWRPGRVHTVKASTDRLLCILPFEPAIYEKHGVDAVFVGHPRADDMPTDIDVSALRNQLGGERNKIVALLPGSRGSEVARLGPLFAETAARICAREADIRFVSPAASEKLRPVVESQLEEAGVRDRVLVTDGGSTKAMAAADVVLLASGTAALESALIGKPTVAAYKVGAITAFILQRFKLMKTDKVTMPNHMTETPLIPEFIQQDARPEAMADAVCELLGDPARCAAISERFAKLRAELAIGSNDRAAEAVISLATQEKRR
jgi:lipid-A-disaccharide synthase